VTQDSPITGLTIDQHHLICVNAMQGSDAKAIFNVMTRRERVRHGRVRGYRPSIRQLEELLQLAQKEIDSSKSSAEITSTVGEYKLTSDDGLEIIAPEHLQALIKEAGSVRELDNLVFSIEQDEPKRYIQINIGPGDWTEYSVESDSDTWTLGRYYELTEKLLSDCTLYAKHKEPRPAMLVMQRDRYVWETVPWKVAENWRISIAAASSAAPAILPIVASFVTAVAYLVYLGDTKVERHKYVENLNHFISSGGLAFFLAVLLADVFIYIALRRWDAGRLKSQVKISTTPIIAQFTFRDPKADPVALASLYIAVAILVATIATQL